MGGYHAVPFFQIILLVNVGSGMRHAGVPEPLPDRFDSARPGANEE